MFCKWCGGNIASSDTKCKRCGKEVPALSDCGGFYDLVPNAKKPSNAQPESVASPEKTPSPPHKPEPLKEANPVRTKNSRKLFLGMAILNVVGFGLVIAMLFGAGSTVNRYATEVNGLQNDLRTISEKLDSLTVATEPVETEQKETDPTIVPNPVLAEQNVIFTAKINNKESAQAVEADLDLGDYTDTAVINYGMDEQAEAVNSICWTLKKADTEVAIALDCNSASRSRDLILSYVIEDSAYGIAEFPETCIWHYRFSGDEEWEDVPADVFVQTNETGKTKLSVRETSLADLIADHEGELEFRCEIFRSNTDSGSFTAVIEGIKFYDTKNDEE